MKTRLLKILRERNTAVSGQELCDMFGVSRTAVWKVINQLKEEGYEISAVQNRGYLLGKIPDSLTKHELESRLSDCEFGHEVLAFTSVDSTNQVIKHEMDKKEHGLLAVAESQTMGKGRRGRQWQSPEGTGIWMSFLIKNLHQPEKGPMITIVAALAVESAIRKVTGLDCLIKWPNDIVLNGKKICGILTEMSAEIDYVHGIVVGIGINANQEQFGDEIKNTATSLYLEGGSKVCRADIVEQVMRFFEIYYRQFLKDGDLKGLREEYNHKIANAGKEVEVLSAGESFRGMGIGIDDEGRLLVDRDGEIVTVLAGEVSVRGIYGYV